MLDDIDEIDELLLDNDEFHMQVNEIDEMLIDLIEKMVIAVVLGEIDEIDDFQLEVDEVVILRVLVVHLQGDDDDDDDVFDCLDETYY